jgi:hypothetical protein
LKSKTSTHLKDAKGHGVVQCNYPNRVQGGRHVKNGIATDDVTDSIAHIEMQRQDAAKESGRKAACNEALRRLHVLLEGERESQQLHDPSDGHSANIEAVMVEIKKIKKLADDAAPERSFSKPAQPTQQPVVLSDGSRIPARNKSRRTMGRSGSR